MPGPAIVTGKGRRDAFRTANEVTIDGFIVENETSTNQFGFGIVPGAGTNGSHILNNPIENNLAGLALASSRPPGQTVIENNLFLDDNQPGPLSGTAIRTAQFVAGGALTNVRIDNVFWGNNNVGVLLESTEAGSQSSTTVSDNTFANNGTAVFVSDATTAVIDRNTIEGSTGSQIVVAGGVNGLLIPATNGFAGTNQNGPGPVGIGDPLPAMGWRLGRRKSKLTSARRMMIALPPSCLEPLPCSPSPDLAAVTATACRAAPSSRSAACPSGA